MSINERLRLRVMLIKDKLKKARAEGLLEAWVYCDAFLAGAGTSREQLHYYIRAEVARTIQESVEGAINDLCEYPCTICKGEGHYWAPGEFAPQEDYYCDCVLGRQKARSDAAEARCQKPVPAACQLVVRIAGVGSPCGAPVGSSGTHCEAHQWAASTSAATDDHGESKHPYARGGTK